ncbi:carboxymethylenebutenolidase [Cooperia oncophora]
MKPLVADRMGLLKKRLLAAVEAIRSLPEVDPERIGAIGYCFGGLCALDLARHNFGLKAAVSFHGTLTPIPEAELVPMTASIQVHHGDADSHIPAAAVNDFMQEMRTRKADWSLTSHGNAEHGFTEPRKDIRRVFFSKIREIENFLEYNGT